MTSRSVRSVAPLVAAPLLVAMVAFAGQAQVVGRLGDGVYRWDASPAAREAASPSISFEPTGRREAIQEIAVIPETLAVRPVFVREGEAEGGHAVATIAIESATSLYGAGPAAGPLLRNGHVLETWTRVDGSDGLGHGAGRALPWVLAVRPDGSAFGVLADTALRCEIDLREGIAFRAEGPDYPVIVIEGATPQEVVIGLANLTGRIPMPPAWAIGYHQECGPDGSSPGSESRVRAVAQALRDHRIPADALWIDADATQAGRLFTFDPERYPDPAGLNDWLGAIGFSSVWSLSPAIKDESGYYVRDELLDRRLALRGADGQVFRAQPSRDESAQPVSALVYPDFSIGETRGWWSGLFADFLAMGVDGVAINSSQPSLASAGQREPGTPGETEYQLLVAGATRDGVAAARPSRRPFVAARATGVGGQRSAAATVQDSTRQWASVDASIPITLNLGLSGQAWAGTEIAWRGTGGTDQLDRRWIGIGALLPLARGTGLDEPVPPAGAQPRSAPPAHPQTLAPEVQATARRALEQRYLLLPHFYTLFHEAAATGLPVARPAFFADPTDPALRGEDNSFLLGDGLLVVAQTASMDRAPVLPRGIWEPLRLVEPDPALPRLYLRGGTILPTGPDLQHTGEKPLDPLTLWVVLDEAGRASGRLYEDAGDGMEYLEGGYRLTTYEAVRVGAVVTVRAALTEGDMAPTPRRVVVHVVHAGTLSTASGREGEEILVPLAR